MPGHSNTLITDHGARAEACSNVGAVKVNVGALRGSVRVLKGGRVVKANFGVGITDHRVPRSAPLGHRAVVLVGQPPFKVGVYACLFPFRYGAQGRRCGAESIIARTRGAGSY